MYLHYGRVREPVLHVGYMCAIFWAAGISGASRINSAPIDEKKSNYCGFCGGFSYLPLRSMISRKIGMVIALG